MTNEVDTKWLARLIRKQYHDKTPVELISANVVSAVPQGENYTSVVLRVKLKMLTESGGKKEFSTIVKTIKSSAEAQEILNSFSPFFGETKMFSTTLIHMEELMNEFNDYRQIIWPKLYGHVPYSVIVLEDLKEKNFTLIDRTKLQDLDHSLLVLRNLGRYHAMSKILLQRGIVNLADKGYCIYGRDSLIKEPLLKGALHMLGTVMIESRGPWGPEWYAFHANEKELGQRLKNQMPTICDLSSNLYENYDKKFEVFNHGDLWSSNMLFQDMEYTGIPIAVKFIDFQISHINSFIWDVIYFIYSSCQPSIRESQLELLFEAYHQSLSDNLKFFNWSGYIPTLDDVKSEAERLLPAALATIISICALTTTEVKDGFVMEEMLSGKHDKLFKYEVFTDKDFFDHVNGEIKRFAELGVI